MTTSFRDGTSSTASTITAPAGIAAGDLLVIADNAASGSAPASVVPTNFTPWIDFVLGNRRLVVSYKLADGTEGGVSITGMNGASTNAKVMLAFDTAGANVLVASTPGTEATSGNPSAQNVAASGGEPPLVVLGAYASNANVSPRTFSTTKDGERSETGATSGTLWLAYKIYNSSPADTSIDMDDEGNNLLASGYISALLHGARLKRSGGVPGMDGRGGFARGGVGGGGSVWMPERRLMLPDRRAA